MNNAVRCSKCNKCIKTNKQTESFARQDVCSSEGNALVESCKLPFRKMYTEGPNKHPESFHNSNRRPKMRQELLFTLEGSAIIEDYMVPLKSIYSEPSVPCNSFEVEIPWKDIAIPRNIKIRSQFNFKETKKLTVEEEEKTQEVSEDDSNTNLKLPWKSLIVTNKVPIKETVPERNDSKLRIPWTELVIVPPIEIKPIKVEQCTSDKIEMPWDDILIYSNIVIKNTKRKTDSLTVHSPSKAICCKSKKRRCCMKTKAKRSANE